MCLLTSADRGYPLETGYFERKRRIAVGRWWWRRVAWAQCHSVVVFHWLTMPGTFAFTFSRGCAGLRPFQCSRSVFAIGWDTGTVQGDNCDCELAYVQSWMCMIVLRFFWLAAESLSRLECSGTLNYAVIGNWCWGDIIWPLVVHHWGELRAGPGFSAYWISEGRGVIIIAFTHRENTNYTFLGVFTNFIGSTLEG